MDKAQNRGATLKIDTPIAKYLAHSACAGQQQRELREDVEELHKFNSTT